MRESNYQANIMKAWQQYGGVCVNGTYTKAGELDLQGGFPHCDQLYYLAVEVKTEQDYHRVMSALRLEDDNTYTIIDRSKLKKHEPMQVFKLNRARQLGGLALFAYAWEQVLDYVEGEL